MADKQRNCFHLKKNLHELAVMCNLLRVANNSAANSSDEAWHGAEGLFRNDCSLSKKEEKIVVHVAHFMHNSNSASVYSSRRLIISLSIAGR